VTDPMDPTQIPSPLLSKLIVGLLAAGVVLLGCAPDLILDKILQVIHASGI